MPAPFRIYNTLSREIEPFTPLRDGHVDLYVCGMTVYDHAHVGHARAFVVFDSFVRYLRHRGWQVRFVRNCTDIDDKIIHRASSERQDPGALAQRFIDSWQRDAHDLGLLPPDAEPRVTESMPQILAMIDKLVETGHAYVAEGNVWYAVDTFAEYGKLSHQCVAELRSADEVTGKSAAADFALWKRAKEGEPAWDSPWGPGRPGWHIECSAMAKRVLGKTLDIHGGGLDLVFPHHENEIAQSEACNGTTFARYWMHNGLLTMQGGKKMGKSLGNVINVRDALVEFPAEALRTYYLQNLYRSPLPWSRNALPEALAMTVRLYEALEVAESMSGCDPADRVARELGEDATDVLELGTTFPGRFYAALDDDFNTPKAMGLLFELSRALNRFAAHKKARRRGGPIVAPALRAFALAREALGMLQSDTTAFHDDVKQKWLRARAIDPVEIDLKLAERSRARLARDWARSDEIRSELEARGIAVMDTSDGVQWRVRLESPAEPG